MDTGVVALWKVSGSVAGTSGFLAADKMQPRVRTASTYSRFGKPGGSRLRQGTYKALMRPGSRADNILVDTPHYFPDLAQRRF